MIRIAAHDLRNPLAAVMGYLELLTGHLDKQGDATALGYLDEATKGAGRMRKIMTDILSLERIEAAAANPKIELFDLRMIVRAVCDEQLFAARVKDQRLTVEAQVPPLVIEGDSAQIREAISNLVNNAIKYTQEQGLICVTLRLEDRLIIFEVEDNGYGVRADQQDRLFEPFFRARSVETRDIEGTGLGLHLVKNIIERHGGRMRFKSEYQKGSTFGFELPAPSGIAG
jgi:signal transduction histidine kinase